MRVLVTGKNGQVASSLRDRMVSNIDWHFAARPEFDLSNAATVERTVSRLQPDLIISAAAYTAVDHAEEDAATARRANVDGPAILASSAARIGAPLIHLSTDYVFDGSALSAYRENDPVSPLGVYGQTKRDGEIAVAESGADFAIVRTSWVYSPYGQNFVKTMLRLAAEQEEVRVVADQFGCPTCAWDIADAILAIIRTWTADPKRGRNEIFHFVGTGSTSWAGFARKIFEVSEAMHGPVAIVRDIPTSAYPTKAKRPPNSRLNSGRFTETFAFRSPVWQASMEQVLKRLLADGVAAAKQAG